MKRELAIAGLILAAAAGVALADEETGVRTWMELRADLVVAKSRVAELEERIGRREAEATALRNDPLALEHAIRQDLGLARPGEMVVRGLGGTTRNP